MGPSGERPWLITALLLVGLILGWVGFTRLTTDRPHSSSSAVSSPPSAQPDPAVETSAPQPVQPQAYNTTRPDKAGLAIVPKRNVNEILVRRFYDDVLNQGQPETMADLFAEQVAYRDHDLPSTILSREALRQRLSAAGQRFDELHYTIENVIVDEDWVSVRWSAAGKPIGSFVSYPATGQTQTWSGVTLWQVSGGQIVAGWQIDPGLETADPAITPDRNANERMVRRFYDEGLNQGPELAMPYLFARQVTYQACGSPSATFISTVEFTQSLLAEQRRFPDLIYTIEHVIVDGDRVSVGWSAEGRPIDPLAIDPASGEKLTWSGLTVWQIANGKIVAGWSIDTGSLCQTQ